MPVLVIDKPVGPSSFQVVRRVRGLLAARSGRPARSLKVGHGGTLDPAASGVLPICLGEATKLAAFLLDADKAYEATVEFGSETDTLDAAGVVVARAEPARLAGLDGTRVAELLPAFRGALDQVPPMYSALKREGRPLYAYARQGVELVRQPRPIRVHELELVAWLPPLRARLRLRCSKGTYVRVLAADLGRALGCGAHLADLRRTASGPFRLDRALTLDELEARLGARARLPLIGLAEALAHLPAVAVEAEVARALVQGRRVPVEALGPLPGAAAGSAPALWRLLREDGTLLAVAELDQEQVATRRVFSPEREMLLETSLETDPDTRAG